MKQVNVAIMYGGHNGIALGSLFGLCHIGFREIIALVEQGDMVGFRAGIGQSIAHVELCRVPDHLAID